MPEVRVVLDTHAWLWWTNADPRFSAQAREAIAVADWIGVPAITLYEVAILVQRRRIELDRPLRAWFDAALADAALCALTAPVALEAARLPGDPIDAVVYGTAAVERAVLLTADRRIAAYDAGRPAAERLVVW